MMKMACLSTALVVMVAIGQPAHAGDAKTGATTYMVKGCIGCHGPSGKSANEELYPSTAGKQAAYLVEKLKAYRAGELENPMMTPMAASLTDKEIADIAAYLAEQTLVE